jgi:hypothetical protein
MKLKVPEGNDLLLMSLLEAAQMFGRSYELSASLRAAIYFNVENKNRKGAQC